MRTVHALGVIVCFALTATACADGSDESSPTRAWDLQAPPRREPSSTTKAKDAVDEPAAVAPSSCKAKTCAELGAGVHADDGCGKPLTCAATCSDASGRNDAKAAARDIGAMSDDPDASRLVTDLTLGDGETDWYSLKVIDSGYTGNPILEVSTTLGLEVTVLYACDSQPDYSTCDEGDPVSEADGAGCKATGRVTLSTECSGLTETGNAYIRVRKPAADGQCSRYTLSVSVK